MITYDAIEMTAARSTTYVDFLGRDEVTAAVHSALGPTLQRSILIGAADWSDKPGGIQAPRKQVVGPTPEFFFVPSYAAGRLKAQPELGTAMLHDLRGFMRRRASSSRHDERAAPQQCSKPGSGWRPGMLLHAMDLCSHSSDVCRSSVRSRGPARSCLVNFEPELPESGRDNRDDS
jgi:hypothetical protein